ncbi:MAG: hypothetical protein HOH19_05425 [Kordiimonadaceae bacterium]|jgi:hypothetical protein|nr:hypothetical protein [Kordiimonadaceae bacterium]MBT6031995.1 hypothetical protein [Kordiimonadaceae bacterium]
MNKLKNKTIDKCDVCGAASGLGQTSPSLFMCGFCGFKKKPSCDNINNNDQLIFTDDINQYFKDKYNSVKKGETFELSIPVSRFYKTPTPLPNQVNFFNSKNIMFLLEQHGLHMVTRKSRFSTQLKLIVRKV